MWLPFVRNERNEFGHAKESWRPVYGNGRLVPAEKSAVTERVGTPERMLLAAVMLYTVPGLPGTAELRKMIKKTGPSGSRGTQSIP
jgi:hypothetical protein